MQVVFYGVGAAVIAIFDLPTVLLALGTLGILTYVRKVPEPLVILGTGTVGPLVASARGR